MKKKQCSEGGQILGSLASLIPGYGQVLGPVIGMADNLLTRPKEQPVALQSSAINPLGYAMGGRLKQYNTGSHASGNDLTVDANGKPDPNGIATVQNRENVVKIGSQAYVMSDVLTNPTTGNTFNVDAASVAKKYPNTKQDLIQRKAFDISMLDLSRKNDRARMNNGGPLDPSVPPSENIAWYSPPLTDGLLPSNPLKALAITVPKPNVGTVPIVPTGNTSSLVPSTTPNPADKFNGIALGLKTLALGKSVFDALQPPEKEKLIRPNYSTANKYLDQSQVDYSQAKQDAVLASNVAANANRSGSTGYNQMLGREAARLATLGDQMGRISEQQSNVQSQINLQRGQLETSKSIDLANRQYQNRIDNQMNQANQRSFGRDLFSNLSQIGSEFNKYGETQRIIANQKEIATFNNNQTLAYLSSKYPNITVNPDIIEKFKSGQINIDDFLTYLPSSVQSDVKAKAQ